MSNEMIELVGRAIGLRRAEIMFGSDPTQQISDDRELAKAAIKAMREPTHKMICAALDDWEKQKYCQSYSDSWKAMIDAALKG